MSVPDGRKRILHLRTVCGRGGGPEKTLLNSPRFLADGYDVRLAYIRPTCDPEYDLPQRAEQAGVVLYDIPERSGFDPFTLTRLATVMREFRPHLLHAHDYKTNFLSLILGRWFRIPVITTAHGNVTTGRKLNAYYRLDRWALRRMDHVIAVSSDLWKYLAEIRVPEARRSLIGNAIDTDACRRTVPVAQAKAKLGLAPDRLLLGAVGRLQPEKGFDVLIRAASLLYAVGFDFDVAIAGDGPLRAQLEKDAAKADPRGRIRFLGWQTNAQPFFEAMDVFVLSSRREGLPNVLLEAMALEVPVVATRIAGVPAVVEDGISGLLVAPDSAPELATAIERVLRHSRLRQTLAAEGRRVIEERFSFRVRMETVRSVYERVLSKTTSPVALDERSSTNPVADGVAGREEGGQSDACRGTHSPVCHGPDAGGLSAGRRTGRSSGRP